MVRLDEYRSLRTATSNGNGNGNGTPSASSSSRSDSRLRQAYSPRPFAKHVGTPPPMNGRIMTYPVSGNVSPTPSGSDDGSYVSTESKEDMWAMAPSTSGSGLDSAAASASASGGSNRMTSGYGTGSGVRTAMRAVRRGAAATNSRATATAGSSSGSRKMVTFKNAYMPDLVPNRSDYLESYDDMVYRVAGLYHTLTGFHESDWDPDYGNPNPEDLEARSVTLMVAEFLFRSAVFLGYKPPPEQQAWLSGFRECKRFSTNDVRRWRRLAHHDWAKEEHVFWMMPRLPPRAITAQAAPGSGFGSSSSGRGDSNNHSVRSKMKKLFHRNHDESKHSDMSKLSMLRAYEDTVDRHINMDNPPPVPDSVDLSDLVVIANACVYYGSYQFSERGIRKLCNRQIDGA